MDNSDQQNQTIVTTEVVPNPITPVSPASTQISVTSPATIQTPTGITDITPTETTITPTPGTTTTITTGNLTSPQTTVSSVTTTPLPISENKPEDITPSFAPPISIEAPVTTPMGTPSVPQTVITTSTVTEEPELPTKKKMPTAVLAVLLLALLTVAGGGTFLISRAISTQQAVAPTAPESQPFAYETPTLEGEIPSTTSGGIAIPPSGPVITDESVDCSGKPMTKAYEGQCFPYAIDNNGIKYWIPQSGN